MNLDTVLALEALKMAITRRQPALDVIHHSNQGDGVCLKQVCRRAQSYSFQISIAYTGNPYDNVMNAMMESLFKTLRIAQPESPNLSVKS